MRIRLLSGDDTGSVKDVPQAEGERLVASGLAEMVPYKSSPAEEETVSVDEVNDSEEGHGDVAPPRVRHVRTPAGRGKRR
jgi:hypothetical protein